MRNPRDTQRKRLYDSQEEIRIWGQTIPNEDLRGWVYKVMNRAAVRSRWGQRHIEVTLTKGGGRAYSRGHIGLGVVGRQPWTILHEIAHCLTWDDGVANHGPEFAGVYLFLIDMVLGKAEGDRMRASFRKHKVRWNRSSIPDPVLTVQTKAVKAAVARERSTRPVTPTEARQAASVLRRAAQQGLLGNVGTSRRAYAFGAARALENVR